MYLRASTITVMRHRLFCAFQGRIYDTVMMALAYMERPAAIQLMRYLSAAHALGYIGLGSSHYAMGDSFFLMINEQHQLLTPKELDVVMAIGPSKGGTAYRTVLTWATMFVVRCAMRPQSKSVIQECSHSTAREHPTGALDVVWVQLTDLSAARRDRHAV